MDSDDMPDVPVPPGPPGWPPTDVPPPSAPLAGAATLPPAPPPPAAFQPPPSPIPVAAARWRSLRGLTKALTVLLWLIAADAVFGIVAYAVRIGVLGDLLDRGPNLDLVRRAHDADHLVGAALGIMALLSLAVYVLIIIWTYRAAKNNEALGRLYPRLKPGWAIAGWLIPFANAVIPVLVLQDLWRGSNASTPRQDPSWRGNKGSGLVGWYWAALLVSRVGYFGRSRARFEFPGELRGLRTHDQTAIFSLVVAIAACVLAIRVIQGLAARQEECLRTQQGAWDGGVPRAT